MDFDEFKAFFIEECNKNNISLKNIVFDNEENNDLVLKQFYNYMIGIMEWNEKINLTAIKTPKEFVVKHFIDSLTISKYIIDNKKVIDIGTGAGFPGIPLKIANNSLKMTLIDSINKKLNVIREVNKICKLENIEIIHTRAEELSKNIEYCRQYDYATTRAVSKLSNIAGYMLPFLKKDGLAICMKGPNYEEEIKEAKGKIADLGGRIEKIDNIIIDNEYERNIIIIKKEK